MVTKRGKKFYIYFRPFKTELVGLVLDVSTKSEAKQYEVVIKRAWRAWSFEGLDVVTRELIRRMFWNRGWELPPALSACPVQPSQVELKRKITLWKGIELCLKYPDVTDENKERYKLAFSHVAEHFGKNYSLEDLWIPQIKEYLMLRGKVAAGSTVNKEKAALSKMFQVMIELRYLENNPCRLVKNLSEKSGERQAYIGYSDFTAIVELLPQWLKPTVQTAYFSGMRRGEILGLERKRVDLNKRIISLGPEHTKEGDFKRVPIHEDLMAILKEGSKVRALGNDLIFLNNGKTFSEDSIRKPWVNAIRELGLDPQPTFHDLRHSFVANCRRSGVSHEIVQTIVGHWNRAKKVSERYGRISDKELVDAIDQVKWDNGETEIYVASK